MLALGRSFLRKNPEVFLLFLVGVIPLLWLRPGYIIAKGDDFPSWLNAHRTFDSDIFLWDAHNMGNANIMGSFMLYELLWLFLMQLGFSVELVQILVQTLFFMGGGFSMYFLSKTVYPKLRLPPLISSMFYMFNFFVLQSRLNIGSVWTYAFLPLLMALLIRTAEATHQQNGKTANKNIIYFAIASTLIISFASINPANVILILLVSAITLLYYIIRERNKLRPLLLNIAKLTVLAVLLNLWWTIPILNYYLWSPSTLNPEVSVIAWSWTHGRASLLNLFRLNGFWGWLPEYVPYYESYSTSILLILGFIPFLLAASTLLFKTNKSRFNAYLMLAVLAFLFLAKGLNGPLSQLNLILYTYIPGMVMFREPVTKFTMAMIPFLALLIGYAGDSIANMKIGKHASTKLSKTSIVALLIVTFIISTYPLVTNPIETRTAQIPFSSYVRIPDYWYEATEWLDNQSSNSRILVTPQDDFYMMPYTWGYLGTDGFITRFVRKPILSYYFGYKINPSIFTALQQLFSTIELNRTTEFKTFLDFLNIEYILQRNDLQVNYTGRNIIPPNEMQAFLAQQPYIRLAKKFGQLDIYEYTDPKPYIYTIDPTLGQARIEVENITVLTRSWNFTSTIDFQEWKSATPSNQWQSIYTITQENNTLRAELLNSTWGWKTINSPLLPAQYGDTYQIQIETKAQNARDVHIKIVEYDQNRTAIAENRAAYMNDGTFDWTNTTLVYEPSDRTMKYMQIQIWHGHETDKPLPNLVWIDKAQIDGYSMILNATSLDPIFQNPTQNQPATVLCYTRASPTRITASVNASQPFMLVVSEALDQSWTAYVNGEKIKPASVYLGLAGFTINQTGQLEITIEYESQKWFFYGSAVSILTFLACLTYLAYNWTKNKAIWNRITSRAHGLRKETSQSNQGSSI